MSSNFPSSLLRPLGEGRGEGVVLKAVVIPSVARNLHFPCCHPRRLSPTLVPDLIGDPVKEWIQAIYEDPGFFSFPFAGKTTLDSYVHWIPDY